METYATALLYAIPFFVILLSVEIVYGYFIKNQKHRVLDSVSSISSGLTNIIKDSLGIGVVLVSYPYLLKHLSLLTLPSTWAVWLFAFIAIDFAGYWNHRLSHHINFFWNQHVIHHSSEEFNLACALRQSISNLLGYFPLLLLPAALVGIPEKVIAILAPAHLFAQFWYHTQHIGKLGWLEYIIVTPSQHRVHHAINKEYIDKNLGQVLSIWDRWFGTFQEELAHVPPQYGVLKPARTWNPVHINFQHLWQLMQDAWHTKSRKDKVRIWFMPTGWRPADVKQKYPVRGIQDVYNFDKYTTKVSRFFNFYILFQMLSTVALLLFLFFNFGNLKSTDLWLYGGLVFLGIYGYTTLMDQRSYAVYLEVFRGLLGLALLYWQGDWFGLGQYLPNAVNLVASYFILTIMGGLYFGKLEQYYKLDSNRADLV